MLDFKSPEDTMNKIDRRNKIKYRVKLIGLVLLVILAVSGMFYMISDIYKDYRTQRDINAFMQGQNYTINELARLSTSCEPVTLYLDNNKSLSLIAIGCLGGNQ